MLRDIFRETFVAQDFLAEGMEKGVAAERMNLLVGLVGEKFPELVPLAEERSAIIIYRPNFLEFFSALVHASDEQAARQILLAPDASLA